MPVVAAVKANTQLLAVAVRFHVDRFNRSRYDA
jgi:hypothetical protein